MLLVASEPSKYDALSFVFGDDLDVGELHPAEEDVFKMIPEGLLARRAPNDDENDSLAVSDHLTCAVHNCALICSYSNVGTPL